MVTPDAAAMLRVRAAHMAENFDSLGLVEARKSVLDRIDDFNDRIISSVHFEDALNRIQNGVDNPFLAGNWLSLGKGVQVWRWEGMTYGRVEDIRVTEDAGRNITLTHRASDGSLHEGIRKAKAHELSTESRQRLTRDGYLRESAK